MLEEKQKKLKEIFSFKKNGNNKKKIENLVVFAVILIITVILMNTIWNGDKKTKEKTQINTEKVLAEEKIDVDSNQIDNTDLEQKLESILQNIEGVGKTKVLLTYSESSQTVAMYNEDSTKSDTEETDTRGTEVGRLCKALIKKKLFIRRLMVRKYQ